MDDAKPVILVVDDSPDNLFLASSLLQELYKVKVATNGKKALNIASNTPPDLILLDVMMPEMDGYETCRHLKEQAELADIPVIFLTAKSEVEDERLGFELGAVDYITKPLSPPLLLSRIKTQLTLKKAQDFLKDQNVYLEAEIVKRMREVTLLRETSIIAMASLAETRDNETGAHIQRTARYIGALARKLQENPQFTDQLTDDNIQWMVRSAPLHDIGKVGIPDAILLKPGALTAAEFATMKTHTTLGRDALSKAEALLDSPETFLHFAKEIAYYHHEKWNGSGYPEGIAAEAIPISARLMALADVYDALISKRVYKPAFSHEKAIELIVPEAGKHFDPSVVETFLAVVDEFKAIASQLKEPE